VVNASDGYATDEGYAVGWVDLDYGVANRSGYGRYSNTNEMSVTEGLLWKYVGSEGVYRCPSQKVVCQTGNGDFNNYSMFPTASPAVLYTTPVRSYTISAGFNSDLPSVRKIAEISHPPPSMAFVFADENLYSISDGAFISPGSDTWTDVPSARHLGCGTFSFAAGHSELHHWQEASTISMNIAPDWSYLYRGPNGAQNRDIFWVLQRDEEGLAGVYN